MLHLAACQEHSVNRLQGQSCPGGQGTPPPGRHDSCEIKKRRMSGAHLHCGVLSGEERPSSAVSVRMLLSCLPGCCIQRLTASAPVCRVHGGGGGAAGRRRRSAAGRGGAGERLLYGPCCQPHTACPLLCHGDRQVDAYVTHISAVYPVKPAG